MAGLAVVLCSAALARADVTGTVTLTGKPPELKPIDMSADKFAALQHKDPVDDPSVVVGPKNELANVVVSIVRAADDPNPVPAATGKVALDQKGCMYEPHVVAMQVGQELVVKNSDQTLHNVHSHSTANDDFNIGMPTKNDGVKVDPQPKVPDYIMVGCDVHKWMTAWVAVFDHPYFAVTDATGKFDIKGLKDGTYTLEFWHELYGKKQVEKVIVTNGVAVVDFEYKAEDAPKKGKKKPAAHPAPAAAPAEPKPETPADKK